MSFSPLPYDIRWTCKLLRRDVRNLKAKSQAKLKTKLKIKLKTKLFNGTKATAPAYQQDEIDTIIVEHETSQHTEAVSTPVSRCAEAVQDTPWKDQRTESEEDADAVRDTLEERLKGAYASRDIEMAHEDRWKFRGSWLLLYTALCVTEMPAGEYLGAAGGHKRFDSGFSTHSKSNLPPKHIWHDILEATTSGSKITSTAESILEHIWPEKDVADMLDQIGNPAKRLGEVEDNELREKLRGLLK